ncbi:MAG: carboxypeptidase regulatory-like domain-containing protein [Acidobacteriota bacterium]|nr:carboxypeptidase regulatory-like domain-containing protein [Acidobacteriota bacterium]
MLVGGRASLGQGAGGTIAGTITDPNGRTIPNAHISIRNVATATVQDLATGESGNFAAPSLLPGSYDITVSAAGFKTELVKDLPLTVGQELSITVKLPVGAISEQVEVLASDTTIETSTSELSNVIDGQTVRELPLNERDFSQLAALQPGVAIIRTQSSVGNFLDRGNRGLGTLLTVAGARPQQNNYRLDGISVNDYTNSGPGSSLGANLGVDAIQEFSVITSNSPAEYGRNSGGIINAITRSGTNAFHGSAYEFARNSALDARNYFDPVIIPPFSRNQFGGTLGGPILKGRTFFFVNYESLRQNLGATQTTTVPSAAARTGQLVGGTVTVDPLVKPYLVFFPLPTSPASGDTGTYISVTQQHSTENFVSSRLDHTLTERDSLHSTYLYDGSSVSSPDLFQTIVLASLTTRQSGTVEYSHIFSPSLSNTVRGGLNRIVTDAGKSVSATVSAAADITLGFVPNTAVGTINVSGLDTYLGGLGSAGEVDYAFTTIQGYDDLLVQKGRHSIKIGGSFERIRDNELGSSIPNGSYSFGSLHDFLTNLPTTFASALQGSVITPRDLRQSIVGVYVQDDFRLRPTLTVNLGLRYEMATVPFETRGQQTNLRNISDPAPSLGSPFFQNPTRLNFEPRVGFAWDPYGNGKTSLRGAFGIYDVLPLTYEYNIVSYLSAPFFGRSSLSSLGMGTFPKIAFTQLTPLNLRYSHVDYNPSRNYVMNWNLNVQRQVSKGIIATVAYIGTRGVHQPFRAEDVNTVLPTLTPLGYTWPSPSGSGTKINPNVGQINGLFYVAESTYHGLQSNITGRPLKNLQFGVSYTWSKSIDDASSTGVGDEFTNSSANLPFYDSRLRRALSDFDIRNNLVLNTVLQVPGRSEGGVFVRELTNGWQVGGIYQKGSGLPFTVKIGGDPLGLKSTNLYDFPNRLRGGACDRAVNPGNVLHYIRTECFTTPSSVTLLGTSRRNSLIGPGVSNFDFSLFKNNPLPFISKVANLQIRAEFFNVLNHTNLAAPVTNNVLYGFSKGTLSFTAPTPTAGQIASTSTTSRQIQFGAKLTF